VLSRAFPTVASVMPYNQRLMTLDIPGDLTQLEYIWIDGSKSNLRSKTRTAKKEPGAISELPHWNFDGSSTEQAPTEDSDRILKPVAMFRDPFRRGRNKLVLCDVYDSKDQPCTSNSRFHCEQIMQNPKVSAEEPKYAFEQEYTLLDKDWWPLGWPKGGFPFPQGPFYCSVGFNKLFGRAVAEAHYRACLYSGVNISGINAEVMPGQWEFQVGPCVGTSVGDHLWVARYLMHRITEEFGVIASLDAKPIEGDWNGAGNHCNFNTKSMLQEGGLDKIYEAIEKLRVRHAEHIREYDPSGGEENKRRLTGAHETASWNEFSAGVAHRGSSIRIPRACADAGKGYLEDRRPAANCDPYVVAKMLAETVLLT
jgi:glutamine synthetase